MYLFPVSSSQGDASVPQDSFGSPSQSLACPMIVRVQGYPEMKKNILDFSPKKKQINTYK